MKSPIKRIRLYEQVAKNLCLKIFNDELPIDSFLPNEDALSIQFGVSKPVIREAMNFLDSKGLVEVRPKVGTRICDSSNWIFADPMLLQWGIESNRREEFLYNMYEFLRLIEPLIIRNITKNPSKDLIRGIESSIKQMEIEKTEEGYINAVCLFHLSIINECTNTIYKSFLKGILELFITSKKINDYNFNDFSNFLTPLYRVLSNEIKKGNIDKSTSVSIKIIDRHLQDIFIFKN